MGIFTWWDVNWDFHFKVIKMTKNKTDSTFFPKKNRTITESKRIKCFNG